jgi:hypothetical protein
MEEKTSEAEIKRQMQLVKQDLQNLSHGVDV